MPLDVRSTRAASAAIMTAAAVVFALTKAPEMAVKLVGTAVLGQVRIIQDNRHVYSMQPNTRTVEFTQVRKIR